MLVFLLSFVALLVVPEQPVSLELDVVRTDSQPVERCLITVSYSSDRVSDSRIEWTRNQGPVSLNSGDCVLTARSSGWLGVSKLTVHPELRSLRVVLEPTVPLTLRWSAEHDVPIAVRLVVSGENHFSHKVTMRWGDQLRVLDVPVGTYRVRAYLENERVPFSDEAIDLGHAGGSLEFVVPPYEGGIELDVFVGEERLAVEDLFRYDGVRVDLGGIRQPLVVMRRAGKLLVGVPTTVRDRIRAVEAIEVDAEDQAVLRFPVTRGDLSKSHLELRAPDLNSIVLSFPPAAVGMYAMVVLESGSAGGVRRNSLLVGDERMVVNSLAEGVRYNVELWEALDEPYVGRILRAKLPIALPRAESIPVRLRQTHEVIVRSADGNSINLHSDCGSSLQLEKATGELRVDWPAGDLRFFESKPSGRVASRRTMQLTSDVVLGSQHRPLRGLWYALAAGALLLLIGVAMKFGRSRLLP